MGRGVQRGRQRAAHALPAGHPTRAAGYRASRRGDVAATGLDRPAESRRSGAGAAVPRGGRRARRDRYLERAASRAERRAAGAGAGARGRGRRAREHRRELARRGEAPSARSGEHRDRLAGRDRPHDLGGPDRGGARALRRALRDRGLERRPQDDPRHPVAPRGHRDGTRARARPHPPRLLHPVRRGGDDHHGARRRAHGARDADRGRATRRDHVGTGRARRIRARPGAPRDGRGAARHDRARVRDRSVVGRRR